MGIVIRSMQSTDIDTVLCMEREKQSTPWPRASFEQVLRLQQWSVVAEEDGVIEGYAVADMTNGHGRTICSVRPNVAIRLYQAWLDSAVAAGLPYVYVEVEEHNIRARQMLEHYAFQVIGVKPHFYGVNSSAVGYRKTFLLDIPE